MTMPLPYPVRATNYTRHVLFAHPGVRLAAAVKDARKTQHRAARRRLSGGNACWAGPDSGRTAADRRLILLNDLLKALDGAAGGDPSVIDELRDPGRHHLCAYAIVLAHESTRPRNNPCHGCPLCGLLAGTRLDRGARIRQWSEQAKEVLGASGKGQGARLKDEG